MAKKEYRQVETHFTTSEAEQGIVRGTASLFNTVVEDAVGPTIILPNAFKRTIAKRQGKIPALYMHEQVWPIGLITSAVETQTGLDIAVQLVDTTLGLDVYKLAKAGVISAFSIGFEPIKETYKVNEEDGRTIRYISEVKLWEVSLVVFPRDEGAVIKSVRTDEDLTDEEKLERLQEENKKLLERITELEAKLQPAATTNEPTNNVEDLEQVRRNLQYIATFKL